MRMIFSLAAAAVLTLAPLSATAEPASEAASALGACLAAVIDKAPVGDIKGEDVEIRRDPESGSCQVRVGAGEAAALRQAVLEAVKARKERFTPARTRFEADDLASREAFCNAALVRRNFNVVVDVALPNRPGARLTATVLETRERDARCDADRGAQKPAG
jgi:hypothetical protein